MLHEDMVGEEFSVQLIAPPGSQLEGCAMARSIVERVVAKSGGLQAVDALAGYVTTERGVLLAFDVFVNNHIDLSLGAA